MMKVHIARIADQAGSHLDFELESSPADIGCADEFQWAEPVIRVAGRVVNTGELLEMTATIYITVCYQCDRCLEEFHTSLELPFFEQFKQLKAGQNEAEDEVFSFQGDEIELSALVRESILVSQPMTSVCSEDCRGLCIKCGNNLNQSDCGCDRYIIDPRLAELQKIFHKD